MVKKLFFALFFTFFIITVYAQNRISYFSKIDKRQISTGVLYDIANPLSHIEKYTGENPSVEVLSGVWKQIYFELYNASLDKRNMKDIMTVRKEVKKYTDKKIYPISIIDYKYDKIAADASEKGYIVFDTVARSYKTTGKGNPFIIKNVFAASVLAPKVYGRKKAVFTLMKQFYFSNTNKKIKYFLIDFGDGKGVQTLHFGDKYIAAYNTSGLKTIKLTAVYSDGSKKYSLFKVKFKDIKMPSPDFYWDNLKADIPYDGGYATGNVAIFIGKGNKTITEPVIIVDGFDPNDSRPIEELFDLANQQNMFDSLMNFGMDAVLLNFHGGADYIQRNAMLVVKLIDTLNQIMRRFGTYKPANQIVVIGPSMGGLITRYALAYMEQNGMEHNVRNWISFDSPQLGANIPLGLQHWVRFFAEVAGAEAAQEAEAALNTPAAQQMLIYHFSATSGTSAGHSSLRDDFVADLNAIGFPQQLRKVAIIDGSGYGVKQPFDPGEQVIYYHYRSWEVDLDGNVWAVPDNTYTQIFQGLYDTALPFDETHDDVYVDNTLPYDDACGGYANTFQEMDNIDPGYGDIVAYYPNHCFIPTISSLAIQNYSDPWLNVDQHRNDIVTPFDTIYYPYDNLFHVVITKEMYWWFKREVYNYKPFFTSTPITDVNQDEQYTYQVSALDSNYWNTLTFTVLEKPDWLNFDASSHTFSGVPTNEDVGVYNVAIKVDDGLKADTQSFVITVHNVNDAPFVNNTLVDQYIAADSFFVYTYPADLFVDIDPGDQLSYSATLTDGTELPSWLTFDPQIHSFYGQPSISDTGVYPIKITATDLSGASAETQFTIYVLNYKPYFITEPNTSVYQDSLYSYTFAATDVNGGADITYQVIQKPEWLAYDNTTHTLQGQPTNDDVGTYNIKIAATNAHGTSYQQYVLQVINVNDPPVYNGLLVDQNIAADSILVYVFDENTFTDIDAGDLLTYKAFDPIMEFLPYWLVFDSENRLFYGQPSIADTGIYYVDVVATDLAGASDTGEFTIRVHAPQPAQVDMNNNVSVYPNPTHGILNIRFADSNPKTVKLLSISGVELIQRRVNNYISLNISYLPKGVYILRIVDGETTIDKNIILVK